MYAGFNKNTKIKIQEDLLNPRKLLLMKINEFTVFGGYTPICTF